MASERVNAFKPGDRVRCIDAAYGAGGLTLGKVYTIDIASGRLVTIAKDDIDTNRVYYAGRFELVIDDAPSARAFKPGDRVRCIDAAYSAGQLTLGKVYTVIRVGDLKVEVVRDDIETLLGRTYAETYHRMWNVERFELVIETSLATAADEAVLNGGGTKFDSNKPRMDLIPPSLPHAVATVLTVGAAKYGDRNWENGISYGRLFGALMRHLWAWWARSGPDVETGRSHLWHAACCIAFLIDHEERITAGTLPANLDDRSMSNGG